MPNKRNAFVLMAAAFAVFLALCWVLLHSPAEMQYQGKSLRELALELSAPDATTRQKATSAFSDLGQRAVPELVLLVQNPDASRRRWVWSQFGSSSLRWLVPGAMRPPDVASMRAAAAQALGIIGTNAVSSVDVLADRLGDRLDVASASAVALARIGSAAVPALIEAASGSDHQVRRLAIFALGEIGPPASGALPVVFEAMVTGGPDVQRVALHSTRQIGGLDLRFLAQAAQSGNPFAMEALVQMQESNLRYLPLLINAVSNPAITNREVLASCFAFYRRAAVQVDNALISSLHDPSPAVRAAAAASLNLPGPNIHNQVKGLIDCLSDTDPSVQSAGFASLQALIRTAPQLAAVMLPSVEAGPPNAYRGQLLSALRKHLPNSPAGSHE